MLDKVNKFTEQDIPVINEVLRKLDDEKWKIRYVLEVPTASTMSVKELVVMDDDTDQAAYIKTAKENLLKLDPIPSGVIVMWSGAISAIPSGWVICDGTNSTPNLTDRFVLHADADSAGTNDVGDTGGSRTISEAQMPAHVHAETVPSSGTGGSLSHNRSDTGHDNAGSEAADVDTASTGSGSDYLPKYYALAYIMKS